MNTIKKEELDLIKLELDEAREEASIWRNRWKDNETMSTIFSTDFPWEVRAEKELVKKLDTPKSKGEANFEEMDINQMMLNSGIPIPSEDEVIGWAKQVPDLVSRISKAK